MSPGPQIPALSTVPLGAKFSSTHPLNPSSHTGYRNGALLLGFTTPLLFPRKSASPTLTAGRRGPSCPHLLPGCFFPQPLCSFSPPGNPCHSSVLLSVSSLAGLRGAVLACPGTPLTVFLHTQLLQHVGKVVGLEIRRPASPTVLALPELQNPPVGYLSGSGFPTCRILFCSACLHLPTTPHGPPPTSPTLPGL